MTTGTDVLDPRTRRILLDGPVNFRDLGGYRGVDGRTVCWRKMFRADGLDSMSERDAGIVFGELGVRTIIDLRTEREVDIVGVGPVRDTDGIEWWNISIIDETQRAWQEAIEGGTITDQYFAMLEGSSHRFVQALRIVAEVDTATVFHCAAGKDRTGLLAALLLSLLGVSDKQIGHDYGLTAEVLPHLVARWEERLKDPRFDRPSAARDGVRRALTADPNTLAIVLASLRERFGSPEQWLVNHGLEPEVADRLRKRLLV